jgi:rare lipoprotein A
VQVEVHLKEPVVHRACPPCRYNTTYYANKSQGVPTRLLMLRKCCNRVSVCYSPPVLATLLSNRIFVAASLALLVAVLALFLPRDGGESAAVSDVATVRSADVSAAPRVPDAPRETDARTMVASYYANVLKGNPTASGEPYQPRRYTAAHKSLPLGTELRVAYEGRAVEVVVNDRGPFIAGRDIDLSLAAAEEIGLTTPGTAPVRATVR